MNTKKTGTSIEKIEKITSSAKKRTKSSKDNILEKIMNKTSELANNGMELGRMTTSKIDEATKIGIGKAKSNSTIQDIVKKTSEVAKINTSKGKENPTRLKKIQETSLGVFEKFIGTIRKGTQYGKTSIEMLGDLAKMKELGIISEEEFESKKKQILDRI
ncbi:MAG: SHOCT domain-containing protein [Nitrosopumilus sp.]|nr:SHOCT domain-containing protein [Nitrosopumilus sp.]MDH3854914.1 SHOCT domain-containing protein [Nitrosopumilus sp.]